MSGLYSESGALWPWTTPRDSCPNAANHRGPEGPCEDMGQCGHCGSFSFSLRPEGETFGWHDADCSLPLRHERACVGGGSGHPPGKVRGYWPGFDAELAAERARWGQS